MMKTNEIIMIKSTATQTWLTSMAGTSPTNNSEIILNVGRSSNLLFPSYYNNNNSLYTTRETIIET